jgi:PEP-CTERM motif
MTQPIKTVMLSVALGFMLITNLLSAPPEPGNVVYDSLTSPPAGGTGYGFGFEIGSAIELHGADRRITQIDLRLSNSAPEEFRVKFYNFNGLTGEPSSLIWESPITTFPYTGSGQHLIAIVNVSVPQIEVPDVMVWVVTPVAPGSSNMLIRTTTSQPSTGTHITYWARQPDLTWRTNLFSDGSFGARLFAVPEPSTLLLVGIGATSLLGYRKAKSQG